MNAKSITTDDDGFPFFVVSFPKSAVLRCVILSQVVGAKACESLFIHEWDVGRYLVLCNHSRICID